MNEETPQEQSQESQELEQVQELESQEGDIIASLESELEQNIKSFEKDFAQKMAKEVENNPELEELFFENKVAFFEKVLQMQNDFVKVQIEDKQQALGAAKIDREQNQQIETMLKAKGEFENAHPDVNVEELIDFYLNELPKSAQEQLENLPPNEFFEALLALTQGGTGDSKNEDELPKQMQGYPTSAQEGGESESLPTNRY